MFQATLIYPIQDCNLVTMLKGEPQLQSKCEIHSYVHSFLHFFNINHICNLLVYLVGWVAQLLRHWTVVPLLDYGVAAKGLHGSETPH